ncbi:MAG TPA: GTPase Era, partial [Solirubrobacterales bacterium]|nr:GTPase Era [Solirubrobacterales bacterium]
MSADLADVPADLREAVAAALAAAGVGDGHLSVRLASEDEIRELNREHRGRDAATDVLAFPVDGPGATPGPRELGDVFVCPPLCADMVEAAVHGVLHLCGYDHETDSGEMLKLQAEVLAGLRGTPAAPGSESEGSQKIQSLEASPSENEETAELSERRTRPEPRPRLGTTRDPDGTVTRTGFIGLAGRPNAGKSTLVNAIVGARVAIVSARPQTTRRAIRGVATDTEAGTQLVLVDLPGVQRPRDVLTERMQRRVERELADSDIALLIANGQEGIGPGDRFIAENLLGAGPSSPVICAVNKIDTLNKDEIAEVLSAAAGLEGMDEVFPISARTGEGVDALVARLAELVPEGPFLYPPEDRTDQPSETLLAELVREQVLNRTREEIPHSVEVAINEVSRREDGLVTIRAEVWVESESQKGILIGRGGTKVREIGTAARRQLELELGSRVF